jgi:hypothetical protein
MMAARGRPAAPALFQHGEEEGGRQGRVGWLAARPIGPEAKKILSE